VEKPAAPKKRRSPPYILGAVVFGLLVILVLLQPSNLWKVLSVETASDTLLLYALSSLNFLAFVIFGFIFIRSLLKLSRERRALELGSKIKTRLLIFFIAVSIMPIVAMAFFSYLFWNRAIDRWFTQIPENVIRKAKDVKNQSVVDQSVKLKEIAQMLVVSLEKQKAGNEDLQKILDSGNLTRLELVSKDNQIVAVAEKHLEAEQKNEMENLLAFLSQNKTDEPALHDGNGFDAAIAAFPDGRRLIVVSDYVTKDESVSQLMDSSLAEFDELKEKQLTVRQIGLLTLGVLTFLLIFASSWTAFYLARGLTVPIKALAEGADEIARGNLAHRVDVLAEDELALLVSAFNQMSAKLEENSAELEDRRKYIETVLQSLSTGVISLDSNNRVTTINKAAAQILKLENADFDKFELEKLVTEENRVVLERLLNRAKRIGQASEQTVLRSEQKTVDAETNGNLPVALTATALPRNFGEPGGVVLVIEDLSELLEAQRASAWSEVARRMAHEIKNPLTPIQLSAERIAKKFSGQSSAVSGQQKIEDRRPKTEDRTVKIIKDGTETILREVNSLKLMVDEFSRFARLPNVRLANGNLNEIVRQTVDLYEDRLADLRIDLNLAENMPRVALDAEQLKRVFVNLIDNAVEAFDQTQTDKRVYIKTLHDAARDLIVAEFSDNGSGIPPSDFQKLFQPYFSTKNRGTGLGLAIVQRIISEHHGKIKAVSNQPRGARFIIELPVVM
jgi:two-component system, NtrC family, nitrogen regulation sensor histidine kinase NtrY